MRRINRHRQQFTHNQSVTKKHNQGVAYIKSQRNKNRTNLQQDENSASAATLIWIIIAFIIGFLFLNQ